MNEATIKELEQLQNEKRKMLLEHETLKMKQREEAFSKELREWKALLKPRKQVKMCAVSLYIDTTMIRCIQLFNPFNSLY